MATGHTLLPNNGLTALIFFLGAEFAQIYATQYGCLPRRASRDLTSRGWHHVGVGVFEPLDHGDRQGHGGDINGLATHEVIFV
jgi:hypothetical protein